MADINSSKTKSFWKRPQGITGILFFTALAYGFWRILPTLITFAENTIYLGLMVGGIALLSYFVIDNRNMLWYLYKIAMYHITRQVYIGIDPIATAKVYIRHLKDKKDDINEQISKLAGNIQLTQTQINDNNTQSEDKQTEAKAAQKRNMGSVATLAVKESIRLQDWNKELQPLLNNMIKTQAFLKKMYDIADYIIKDKESEISITEKKYKSVKIAFSALKSAQAVMGQDAKDAGFEQAMEFIKEDMANKLGEMDRILELSTPYINEFDLQSAIQDDRANELLNSFNETAFNDGLNNLTAKVTPVHIVLENKAEMHKSAGVAITETPKSYDTYFK